MPGRWERAPYRVTCGRCGRSIERNECVRLFTGGFGGQLRTPKRRCADCAGEPAPTDLAVLSEPEPRQATLTRIASVRSMAQTFDWKAAQLREDEP